MTALLDKDILLPEEGYAQAMDGVVAPYLEQRSKAQYLERESGKKIYYVRAVSDRPQGVVVLSHGYTETVEKHRESIYYFLREGFHVFMHEHCGHGRSYRLGSDEKDLSLVHVDDYMRYVEDLLLVCRTAAQEFPDLPLYLYGHSMGGGIAAAAAAKAPELFSGLVLSSPMIRPSSAPIPWRLAALIAKIFCLTGGSERYLIGHHAYDGSERFADSAGLSEARFLYYQKKRDAEPLFQTSAGSYGWLWQAARLHRFLMGKAWRDIACPILLFQAEREAFVANGEQERFAKKKNKYSAGSVEVVRVPGAKHEIFNSGQAVREDYWTRIFAFLIANRGNLQ
ncbi:MAG: alpha/beta hydrolase [Bacteroidales bacterium]|nr:alpha/beta hydrolase [Bacteroidales bacterium]MCM1416010.1 alpha/beta hydrolase [bacterium]MCM1423824.1 alpha/beta hydrolase [bacterium]